MTKFDPDVAVPKPHSAILQNKENKNLLRQFLTEGLTSRDGDSLAEFLTEDHIQHGPAPYQTFTGSDGAVEYASRLWTAFPDLTISITDMMAMGDRVIANGRMQGKHMGDLVLGDTVFEPTERGALWNVTVDCRVEDGKIAETRIGMARADLMQQLGLRFSKPVPISR